jgi:hypothetical protein
MSSVILRVFGIRAEVVAGAQDFRIDHPSALERNHALEVTAYRPTGGFRIVGVDETGEAALRQTLLIHPLAKPLSVGLSRLGRSHGAHLYAPGGNLSSPQGHIY